MTLLGEKTKEVVLSVLPVVLTVILARLTIIPISNSEMIRFILGALLITLGLSFFLMGVEIGVTPIGRFLGERLTRTGTTLKLALLSAGLAFLISVAEPDLRILANQVDFISSGLIPRLTLIAVVSAGLAVMMAVGMIRIVRNIPLYIIMFIFYSIIFVLSIFAQPEFLSVAFDASGATTGALAVPVILALAIGASALKKDTKASEKDSFGLVGIASIGPVLAVLILSLITKPSFEHMSNDVVIKDPVGMIPSFGTALLEAGLETLVSLLPIILIYIIVALKSKSVSKRSFQKSIKGVVYAFAGLTLFLGGVHAGFLDVGRKIGFHASSMDNHAPLIITAFVLGFLTVLAEPAVHVLTSDIERVTGGYVKKNAVLLSLSIGVSLAISFSVIRILFSAIALWHFLLPGYIICLIATFFAPKIFVGMAFDAGGVASGPMTATFILAFTSGAATAIEGANPLADGFGMIAMVAMMPIITVQILGVIFKIKSRKGGYNDAGS